MILDIVDGRCFENREFMGYGAHTIYQMVCGERSFGEGNNSLDPKSVESDKNFDKQIKEISRKDEEIARVRLILF